MFSLLDMECCKSLNIHTFEDSIGENPGEVAGITEFANPMADSEEVISANDLDDDPASATVGTGRVALPKTLRILCLDPLEPEWVQLTMHLDRSGCPEPRFRWVSTETEALTVLRERGFDVLVASGFAHANPAARPLDLTSFVRAVRESGYIEPVLLLAAEVSDREWSEFCEEGCDILVTSRGWNSPALVPMLRRLVERRDLCRENRRLVLEEHRRCVRERDEAEQLLKQQRQILGELEALTRPQCADAGGTEGRLNASAEEDPSTARADSSEKVCFPRDVVDGYQAVLRSYVMTGSENLGPEISRLAERFISSGLGPREMLQLHVERVESLVEGLGHRSARHVLARADLLAMELMVHLGECHPWLPGAQHSPVRRVNCDGGIDLTEVPPV